MLPQPPPTLPVWAKVIYYVAESILVGYTIAQYDNAAEIAPVGASSTDITAGSWRRFDVRWEDTTSGELADDQYFTIDIVNITSGQLDGTWNQADYDIVFAVLYQMCQAMAPNVAIRYRMTEIKAYIRGFNPYTIAKPFATTGPPEAVNVYNLTGGAVGTIPPQVCSTVTEETPSRKHWGRCYMPTFGINAYDASGRLAVTAMDALATNFHDHYVTLMNSQYFPVVPTVQSDKQPARTLQTVTGIRVDDVPDVHRSRRFKSPIARKILPVAAQVLPAP